MSNNARLILSSFLFLFALPFQAHATPGPDLNALRPSECETALSRPFWRLEMLPARLREMRQMIDSEFQDVNLDGNLRSFWGFHNEPGEIKNRMRPWNKMDLGAVDPTQIVGMSREEFVNILRVAMEIEDPILSYSAESGKGFRYLLPSLGRFMGRNEEQMKFADLEGRANKCESPWCSEENRHGNLFARLIERLSGTKPDRGNAAIPTIVANDERGAARHLNHRQGTEWGASAAYFLLATHSRGALRDAIMNVIRDEIKHLTVVSGADVYLNGHRPNSRTWRIFEKTRIEFMEGQKSRTGGADVFRNPYNLVETIAAHVMIEIRMRRYLRSLPFQTLREVFDSESRLPPLRATALTREEEAATAERTEAGRMAREELARWPKKQREAVFVQKEFAERNAAAIQSIIEKDFGGFKGATEPESEGAVLQAIDRFDNTGMPSDIDRATAGGAELKQLRQELHDRFIDYRVMNREGRG